MFGKKYYTEIKKGDAFSLLCVIIILIALGRNTYLAINPSNYLKQIMTTLSNNEAVISYCGQVKSVYYEPLLSPKQMNKTDWNGAFYAKGQDKTLIFAVDCNKKTASISKIYLRDGLYSYSQVWPAAVANSIKSATFWPLIFNYLVLILIPAFFRIVCVLFPDSVLKIVEFPNKLFKVGKFQETVFPFILLCDGGLILIVFNLCRTIYIIIG